VTNWPAYEAGLRPRGSLTLRFTDAAIERSLSLRTVFHQPLRRTEGRVGPLLGLMGLDLPVPEPVGASAATVRRVGPSDRRPRRIVRRSRPVIWASNVSPPRPTRLMTEPSSERQPLIRQEHGVEIQFPI